AEVVAGGVDPGNASSPNLPESTPRLQLLRTMQPSLKNPRPALERTAHERSLRRAWKYTTSRLWEAARPARAARCFARARNCAHCFWSGRFSREKRFAATV